MARTVLTHPDAEFTFYFEWEFNEDDPFSWDDLRDNIFYSLPDSYYKISDWFGRELLGIAANDHCIIGISTYNQLCALWCIVKDHHKNLSPRSVTAAKRALKEYDQLHKLGCFSNGEGVYRRKEAA